MASNKQDKHSPIQFFMIITTTSIEGGNLKLPNAFTRKYSGDMSNPVFLKPLDNISWEINWSKQDSDIWLQNVWEEFVKHYSLDQGHMVWHLVLFEFKGPSKFEVRIFDKNALEIKYLPLSNKQIPNSATRFFRIITLPCLEAGELILPNGFMKKYSGGMSNPVFLKAPDNTSWEIHWSKHDSYFWFQKGWKEFVKYYSLDHEHLVLFEFKDASHFRVHIFDKSTLEIEYPSNENQGEEHNPDQIGDEIPPPKKTKPKSPMSLSQPRKKLRTGKSKDVGKSPELRKRKKVQVEDDVGGSTERATFVVELQPYSIDRYSLRIPLHFARTHLKMKKGDIRLERLDGRTWKVYYSFFKLGGGWKKFATDNNLKVGDICVFELTKREPLSLKVLIFPVAQGGVPSSLGPHFTNAAQREARKYTPKNPSFTVSLNPVIKPAYRPPVPISFIREYLNEKKQIINLKIEEKLWPVEFIYYPEFGLGKLSKGWIIFAKESKLVGGDVCVFELINKDEENPVLEVHIFKGH
ncbi:B3 domain-containing transcription factor VRN1-like [Lotus japonicus]|uniref:B3 domain-containing transcription factor VRN1-like n=1 Tax=Lotus japonicus TaxID=34305 RepID=UPI00258AE0FE|nr:B3 domain-containing transcription factor VRN1-like [Lotus japonicus]